MDCSIHCVYNYKAVTTASHSLSLSLSLTLSLSLSLSAYSRGYGETEKPHKISDYAISKMTQDIVELVGNIRTPCNKRIQWCI